MIYYSNDGRKHKFLFLILAVLLITLSPFHSISAEDNTTFKIPNEATRFATKKSKDIIEVVTDYKHEFHITSNNANDFHLGIPYLVYDLDEDQQDEIYYFPVLDDNNKVILTLSVIGTTNGWGLSISEEMAKELNQIDDLSEEYIFYESDNNLVAESSNEVIYLSGNVNTKCSDFQAKDYKEKKKIINELDLVKTDTLNKKIDPNRKDKYTPSYSESTSTSKVCSLNNEKGQGGFGDCWAAAVATISNYRNGTNISPTEVCDTLKIGYNKGAGIGVAQLALTYYDLYYNNLSYYQLPWLSITKNLDYKYPIYVSATDYDDGGHAVTVYGYRTIDTDKYVVIWNSGLFDGIGGLQVAYYDSLGTTFSYNYKTWTWVYSLSWIQ